MKTRSPIHKHSQEPEHRKLLANTTEAFVNVDTPLSERTYFSANSTGGAESGLCSTYEITFQLKDVESVSVANSTVRVGDADVDELSKYNNVPSANAVLKDTQFNSLVYPLPDSPIQMVANVEFTYKTFEIKTTDSSGNFTLTLSGTDTFPHSDGTLTSSQAEESFIIVAANTDTVGESTTGVKVSNGQYNGHCHFYGISEQEEDCGRRHAY